MKKSLLAVAALGAFASAAQAQSSVTVYGILDFGFVGSNTRSANNNGSAAGGSTSAPGVVKTTQGQFSDNAESTSRLGFKGTEDLGGGLSAFFTIETAISPDAQNTIQTNVSTSNRQTFAGLKRMVLVRLHSVLSTQPFITLFQQLILAMLTTWLVT